MQEGKRSTAGLAHYVAKFSACGVLVIGDIMLDEYISGAVERISPEAPVAVVNVRDVEHRLGGAANVTNNIRALGAKAHLAGVVGPLRHLATAFGVARLRHEAGVGRRATAGRVRGFTGERRGTA